MTERLLIDAGNSRLKWRHERGDDLLARGTITYAQHEAWADAWQLDGRPASIWLGSVAGADLNDRIAQWAAQHQLPTPTLVATERERLGLRVSYRDVSRLGVDRFLAMLGARDTLQGALCVADVGTALTLDAVDARGMHKGGLIAPGPATMVKAVLAGTARIDDASDETPRSPFARDTADAVTGGARYAAAALIDRFVDEARLAFRDDVILLLTGGGRQRVAPLLRTKYTESPDLVFDGLRALADASLL